MLIIVKQVVFRLNLQVKLQFFVIKSKDTNLFMTRHTLLSMIYLGKSDVTLITIGHVSNCEIFFPT